MFRLRLVLLLVVVMAAAAGVVGVAHAGPLPPCSFTLSAPQVVRIAGADMVTATVVPDQCGWPAAASFSVACLQPNADGSGMTCMQGRGADRAQVFTPYRLGTSYTASGRGCGAWDGHETAPDCQILGPITGPSW